MSAPELKPCPYCGSEMVFRDHAGGWPESTVRVECSDWTCPSRCGGCRGRQQAADKWNTRAATEADALRAALIEVVGHCRNYGRGCVGVDDRIIERCEETAMEAIAETNP